ncbi:hypothetical protein [Giesbergeria anulus]|uniref:Uncharacterized protein n=1 Tax=Giesbergeria anulus TaxID=180197 RepID=A0A1H9F7R7_9BURK|nr:hypothetical protein [Giesbergeria anulus]SEQ33483.1 hypothetical protein SAMN02982919_00467 [Giesbergeria anulus]
MGYENDRAGYWRNCDLWSFSEVQCLLNGEWPDECDHPPSSLNVCLLELKTKVTHELGDGTFLVEDKNEAHVIRSVPEDVGLPRMIEDAITAGKLTPIAHYTAPRYKHHLEPRFRPDEVIAWAISRGCFPDFPFNNATLSTPAPNELAQLLALAAPAGVADESMLPASAQKRWTPQARAELAAYRQEHGTKKAALHFGVTEQRIRQLLPSKEPRPKGYSAFNQRTK